MHLLKILFHHCVVYYITRYLVCQGISKKFFSPDDIFNVLPLNAIEFVGRYIQENLSLVPKKSLKNAGIRHRENKTLLRYFKTEKEVPDRIKVFYVTKILVKINKKVRYRSKIFLHIPPIQPYISSHNLTYRPHMFMN